MSNVILIKTRKATPADPGAPATLEAGELAVNLGGDKAGDTRPALYVGDETGAVHRLVSEADVKQIVFVDAAQLVAGTETGKAIDPATLATVIPKETLAAGVSGGTTPATGVPADKDKIVILDATGKIPAALIPITGLTFTAADLTVAAVTTPGSPGEHVNGKVVTHTGAAGALDASWGVAGNPQVRPGDMLLSDGTTWHLIEGHIDPTAYLALAGGAMLKDAKIEWPTAGATPGNVILDGGAAASATVKNVTFESTVLDAGTY